MRKPEPTITVKEHNRIIAAKDKLITELANIVDELQLACNDFTKGATPLLDHAKRIINRKSVSSVAWPPRKVGQ
jgi:hypothetical protein